MAESNTSKTNRALEYLAHQLPYARAYFQGQLDGAADALRLLDCFCSIPTRYNDAILGCLPESLLGKLQDIVEHEIITETKAHLHTHRLRANLTVKRLNEKEDNYAEDIWRYLSLAGGSWTINEAKNLGKKHVLQRVRRTILNSRMQRKVVKACELDRIESEWQSEAQYICSFRHHYALGHSLRQMHVQQTIGTLVELLVELENASSPPRAIKPYHDWHYLQLRNMKHKEGSFAAGNSRRYRMERRRHQQPSK